MHLWSLTGEYRWGVYCYEDECWKSQENVTTRNPQNCRKRLDRNSEDLPGICLHFEDLLVIYDSLIKLHFVDLSAIFEL